MSATPEQVKETAITPMRRQWKKPPGFGEQSLVFQLEELTRFLTSYPPMRIQKAFSWLQTNYKYATWPKIVDWSDALNKSNPAPTSHRTYANDLPWIKRENEAKEIFKHSYSETPLAQEMADLNMFSDYYRQMVQVIKYKLQNGQDPHNATLPHYAIEGLRERGRKYTAGRQYREQHSGELSLNNKGQ